MPDLWQQIVQGNPDAVIILDLETKILFLNSAAEQMFGFSLEDVKNQSFDILFPREAIEAQLRACELESLPKWDPTSQVLARRKEGIKFRAEVHVSRLNTQGGPRFCLRARDVTEETISRALRDLAAQELRASEEKYRKLVESSPDAIVVHVNGKIAFANTACVHLMRANSVDDLIGKPILDRVHPDSLPLVLQRMQQSSGIPLPSIEERLLRIDGTPVDVEVIATPIKFWNTDAVQLIVRDLTDRRRTEAALRESRLQLRIQKQRLELALQASRIGFFTLDLASGFADCDDRVFDAYGQARESFEPNLDNLGRVVLPEDRASVLRFMRLIRGSGRVWHEVYRVTGADQRIRFIEAFGLIIRQPGGAAIRVIGTVQDVSARKHLEKELNDAREAASLANHAKSKFLATISHEIRTPLNSILGFLELLDRPDLTPARRECVRGARLASGILLRLVNDFLDISRIEAGMLALEEIPFHPRKVAAEMLEAFLPVAAGKDVQIKTEIDSGLPTTLIGDPSRLVQILTNLMGNALKFTPKGEVVLSIRVRQYSSASIELFFEVRDTGIGMAEDALRRIFIPYAQGHFDTARQYGGSGLGLSIAHELVTLLGGQLRAESQSGSGSKFFFSCSFKQPHDPVESEQIASEDRPQPTGGSQMNVLLAEDDPLSRKFITLLLEEQGIKCDSVTTGLQALDSARNKNYDLILMDCLMPVMDGYRAAYEIRAMESLVGRRTPIIALTANALEGAKEKCIRAGMDDYISKPISFDALLQLLEKLQKTRVE